MKKVHLKITEVPNNPKGKPFSFTACGQSLASTCRQLEAVPDFRAVTCLLCQKSDYYWHQKESLIRERVIL